MLRKSNFVSHVVLLAVLIVFVLTTDTKHAFTAPGSDYALNPHLTAVGLAPLQNVTQIAVGWVHTCVLMTSGGVKCWGYNASGQLGDGTNGTRTSPVDVIGLNSGVNALAAGGYYTCALMTSGGVRCWGNNGYGQLGNGTTTDSSTPVAVVGLNSGVTALAAGGRHICALMTNGGVKCWGYNNDGQLGDGTTITRTLPVDVVGLSSGVSTLSAGWVHTCALKDGGVKCWGYNTDGELGDGTTTNSSHPVAVVGLSSGVSTLDNGGSYTCALMTNSSVKCWGYNGSGQLGDGTADTRLLPVDVLGLSREVSAITAGGDHTCALVGTSAGSGSATCWGYNNYGQLGDGATTDSWTPVAVVGLSGGVNAIGAGNIHTCALMVVTGGVKCWGNNTDGQLGDGTTNNRLTPVDVLVEVTTPLTPTASPTNTPLSSTPTLTDIPSTTLTPTPVNTGDGSQILLPLVVKPPPTPTAPTLPHWQRIGQSGLNVAALARQGDQLFAGERKETGYPGGLYKRSLATCATAPDLIRLPNIESSVLGLALQGVQGVVAAYDIGMLYTTNGGDTWTQSASKVSNPRTVEMSSGIIYAATENDGLSYSEDGGITWTPRSGEPKAINVLKIQASTVWIGTDTTGVWKLIAGGNAPVQQNNGLNNNASREIWDLGFAADNMIYLATEDGVYRGTGNTNSPWQPFALELKGLRSLEFVGDQLYAGVLHGGVWRHALTGGNWQPVTSAGWNNTLTVRDLFYDTINCHGLLAATNDGIWLYR